MTNCFRHISVAILSGILFLPILASSFLQLGQTYIKLTRDERLESEKLVKVVVPAKDIVWEEEGKELWVGDRMFDVTSLRMENGNYYLTGVFDDDETEIAGSLLHIFFSQKGNHLLHLLLLLQCFSATLLLIQLTPQSKAFQSKVSFYLAQLLSLPHLVLGSPPRQ